MLINMPNRRPHDHVSLVSKMVSLGISKVKAESIVSGLSVTQITNALNDAKALKAIIDIPSRNK